MLLASAITTFTEAKILELAPTVVYDSYITEASPFSYGAAATVYLGRAAFTLCGGFNEQTGYDPPEWSKSELTYYNAGARLSYMFKRFNPGNSVFTVGIDYLTLNNKVDKEGGTSLSYKTEDYEQITHRFLFLGGLMIDNKIANIRTNLLLTGGVGFSIINQNGRFYSVGESIDGHGYITDISLDADAKKINIASRLSWRFFVTTYLGIDAQADVVVMTTGDTTGGNDSWRPTPRTLKSNPSAEIRLFIGPVFYI